MAKITNVILKVRPPEKLNIGAKMPRIRVNSTFSTRISTNLPASPGLLLLHGMQP